MRSKLKAIFVLGVIVALIPQLGLYRNWKVNIASVGGIIIAVVAYLATRDLNFSRRRAGDGLSRADSPRRMHDVTQSGSVRKDDAAQT